VQTKTKTLSKYTIPFKDLRAPGYIISQWIVREPREEPEGRPGGPGDLKTAEGAPPRSCISPWSLKDLFSALTF